MKTAIVTDSTCDFDLDFLASRDIRMVPLNVIFGDRVFKDRIELGPDEFYDMLSASKELPSTSQPSPAEFSAMYERLALEGYEHIVSIHIAATLSGTYNSAYIAAQTSPIPVTVVDSETTSQALGLAVTAAADERDAGGSAAQIAHVALEVSRESEIFFVIETMENLVRGGRAGKAQGFAASLLNIKPILTLADGLVVPWNKAKGRKRAFEMISLAVEAIAAEKGPVTVAMLHSREPQGATELHDAIAATGADVEFRSPAFIGAVIATHVALGCVGCAVVPRR